jgi:YidC/Oxa1 family membrane protein insertase
MEKRIFLAIVISLGFLWLWAAVAPKLFPDMFKRPEVAKTAAASTTTPAPPATPPAAQTATTSTSTAAPSIVAAAAVTPVRSTSVTVTTVDTPLYTAKFSNRGAQLISFRLKNYKVKGGSTDRVDLVRARASNQTDYPFYIEARDPKAAGQLNAVLYALTDRTEGNHRILQYRYVAANGVGMTKTFKLGNEYQFEFATAMSPAQPYRVMLGPGIRTLSDDEQESTVIITGNGVVEREGKAKVFDRVKGDAFQSLTGVDYIGLEDNYFLSILRPQQPGASGVMKRATFPLAGKSKPRKDLYAGLNAGPDGVAAGHAFFGPKEAKLVDSYGLGNTLQLGFFSIIARFFLSALQWINKSTHNYGFAIIVLTILIKVVLYPLQHKSIVSMKRMQRLQPKMDAIKNKYKKAKADADQRQKMNVEMMALYQKEGINPMSGCFPIVMQLPILWAFYGLLSRAIELRGAPFILWIHDLSEKDPYYILPLLMTITWVAQTYITPSTADPMQRRIFMIMPIMFGWFFKEFPSGLVLYWLVQNVLTIIQQSIMNKWWKDHPSDLQKS